jgi:hypothetical protein
MFYKLKSPVFIDSVVFEFTNPANDSIQAELINEEGSVCSRLDATVPSGLTIYKWNGLNDLPYGVYTLALLQGNEEHRLRLVKRV